MGRGGAALSRCPLYRVWLEPRADPSNRARSATRRPPPIASRLVHEDRRRRGAARGIEADVLAFAVRDPVELSAAAQGLDRLVERLTRLVEVGELKGDEGRVTLLHADGRLAAQRVGAVGLGAYDLDADRMRTAAARVAARRSTSAERAWPGSARRTGCPRPSWARRSSTAPCSAPTRTPTGRPRRRGAGRSNASCSADRAPRPRPRRPSVRTWPRPGRTAAGTLSNSPANMLTPENLAAWAEEIAAEASTSVSRRWGRRRSARPAWAPSRRSARATTRPRLITLAYEPPEPAKADLRVGLVGKAITFDSGGSLRPAYRMDEMKSDMGGGGAVLAATGAIAELGLPVRISRSSPPARTCPAGTPSGRATSSRR